MNTPIIPVIMVLALLASGALAIMNNKAIFEVEGSGPTVIEAEGFATAATINEAKGHTVIAAFSATNLAAVANMIRSQLYRTNTLLAQEHECVDEERGLQREHPVDFTAWQKFIIAADDDWQTKDNPGIMNALAAAREAKALIAVPDFGKDRADSDTDFNDLEDLEGLEAVAEDIDDAIEPQDLLEEQLLADPHSAHADVMVAELAAWKRQDAVVDEKLLAELKREGVRVRDLSSDC